MTDKKIPFSDELIRQVAQQYGTPFHIYDEKGIRENVKALKEAFSWNKGYKEYFAVKVLVFFVSAVFWILCPQWVGIIQWNRTFYNF